MNLTAGLNLLRDAMYGDSVTFYTHIAVGTGTTAVAATDTALVTEIHPDGANRSAISSRTKPSAKKVRYQMLVGAGEANGHDLTEVGAANAASAGTFMNRIVHTKIEKDPTFELKYQIQNTLSDV